ncbi:MAG: GNAT family N-acetyltransferase [Thermoplasmata archaeon]|nr:GNAT family N-acetyltransferase [Thermoplasmata archaeon]
MRKQGALEIKPITEHEISDMIKVWKDSGLPYRPTGRDNPARLRKQFRENPEYFLGAYAGGKLAAVSLITDDGRKGWINRLAVLPEHRRKGIAVSLIRASENVLRKKGIHLFCVNIESDNKESMDLFRKAGYAFESEILYYTKRERKDY